MYTDHYEGGALYTDKEPQQHIVCTEDDLNALLEERFISRDNALCTVRKRGFDAVKNDFVKPTAVPSSGNVSVLINGAERSNVLVAAHGSTLNSTIHSTDSNHVLRLEQLTPSLVEAARQISLTCANDLQADADALIAIAKSSAPDRDAAASRMKSIISRVTHLASGAVDVIDGAGKIADALAKLGPWVAAAGLVFRSHH